MEDAVDSCRGRYLERKEAEDRGSVDRLGSARRAFLVAIVGVDDVQFAIGVSYALLNNLRSSCPLTIDFFMK